MQKARRGSVLVFSLVVLVVTTTIAGALCTYYAQSARVARFYRDHTSERFAAQRVIETATADVQGELDKLNGGSSMTGNASGSQVDLSGVIDVFSALDGSVKQVGDYSVTLSVEGASDLKSALESSGYAEVKIVAQVTGSGDRVPSGGITLEQTLVFETTSSAMTTLEIFDYVYFANNHGRLNSSNIVANGAVGANGDFDLAGATVNGFVKAAGEVTIDAASKPKTWPRTTYMAKVAAEYDDYFTQTRPTDPIIGSVNGETYSIAWPGGYDPAVSKNPYSFSESPPTPVDPPGEKPTKVAKPEFPVEPTKAEVVYESYPDKETDDYGQPDEPPAVTRVSWQEESGSGKKKKTTTYYQYSFNGTKYGSPSKSNRLTDRTLSDSYNKAVAARNDAVVVWKQECESAYQEACAAVDERNAAAEQKAEDDYQAALVNYEYEKMVYSQQNALYITYCQRLAEWNEKDAAYQQYLSDLEDYNERYSKYITESSSWDDAYAAGESVEELTKSTYSESSVTNTIIKERYNLLEWPEEVTDWSACREYCRSYRLETTNSTGVATKRAGSLVCDNMSGSTRLSFTCTGTNRTEYVSSRYQRPILISYQKGELIRSDIGSEVSIKRTVNSVNVTGGVSSDGYKPFSYEVKNVSGSVLSSAMEQEAGSVVLIGTSDHPIKIDGPVYVNGDVVIRGLVSGRGTIYARRNIHIIGDITYQNPPNWPHEHADLNLEKFTPSNVKVMNAEKDLLSLVAIGNIIVGDYTADIWTNGTQLAYLDLSDGDHLAVSGQTTAGTANIPKVGSENHDYTAEDGGTVYDTGYAVSVSEEKYGPLTGLGIKWYYHTIDTYAYGLKKHNRRFYETVLGDAVIAGLKQSSVELDSGTWNRPTRYLKKLIYSIFGIRAEQSSASGLNPANVQNTDAGDVIEIDSVLYANHGIFGVVGGEETKSFTLNGALLCRDEGLLTSFDDRFGGSSAARLWLNWDMRVKSNSAEGIHTGLVEEPQTTTDSVTMWVKSWRQVK